MNFLDCIKTLILKVVPGKQTLVPAQRPVEFNWPIYAEQREKICPPFSI